MSIGVVFTGQGSQRVGMAKDFYEQFIEARDCFKIAEDAIGLDLKQLCFEENTEINQTKNTQPAILTCEIAIYEVLRKTYSFMGHHFGGHSLGEFTALTAAGVIPFQDAVRIVRKRGELMQAVVPSVSSGMAALIYDDIENIAYRSIVEELGLEVANLNAKNQTVISGTKEAMEKAKIVFMQKFPELEMIPLNVNIPFHSSVMKKIEAEFEDYLLSSSRGFKLEHCLQVLSNYTGSFYEDKAHFFKNLSRQMSSPVQWIKNMKALHNKCDSIYEIGPNKHLTSFFASLGIKITPIIQVRAARRAFET